MGPAASADWLICLIARLDAHVGHPALVLPVGQVLRDVLLNNLFTLEVFGRDRSELKLLALSITLGRPMPPWGTIGLALLVGAVCYGLSIQLFILALRGLGTARTSTLFGIAPFVGTTLSLLFLNDKPQILFWAALPVMLVGAWLMLTENHQHRHIHEPLEHTHAHDHSDNHHNHQHTPEELGEKGTHSHLHYHERLVHSHAHVPDLHHRHDHSA